MTESNRSELRHNKRGGLRPTAITQVYIYRHGKRLACQPIYGALGYYARLQRQTRRAFNRELVAVVNLHIYLPVSVLAYHTSYHILSIPSSIPGK